MTESLASLVKLLRNVFLFFYRKNVIDLCPEIEELFYENKGRTLIAMLVSMNVSVRNEI